MSAQQIVYVSTISTTHAEIRVRDSSKKPTIVIISNRYRDLLHDVNGYDDEKQQRQQHVTAEESINNVEICRVMAGHWRCIIRSLQPGTSYVAKVISGGTNHTTIILQFTTISSNDLGNLRLRIGIIADAHVNVHTRARNGQRLYQSANTLFQKYTHALEKSHNVDCIILPGDVCDTGSEQELYEAYKMLQNLTIPYYAVLGNHECNAKRFAEILCPRNIEKHSNGYYSVNMKNVYLIMLATDTQDSLDTGTDQLKWLSNELESHHKQFDIMLVVMHYSLLIHPLHNNGKWDDGLQVLNNAAGVLKLLHRYPTVRGVICGHKNVPSMLVDQGGLIHTLSPQLIQVPCGYDIIEIYDHGMIRIVHEIDEMNLQHISKTAAGEKESMQRWGKLQHRSFRHNW